MQKENSVERPTLDYSSIFLRLPLGAGSRGVRVYVTVLVTTCLTFIDRGRPVCGGSGKYRVFPSMIQLVGEKGERGTALRGVALRGVALFDVVLRGDSLIEE